MLHRTVFVTAFSYCLHFTTLSSESQTPFSSENAQFWQTIFVKNKQLYFLAFAGIDKPHAICLNILSIVYFKNFDGKFALFMQLQRVGGRCKPMRQG